MEKIYVYSIGTSTKKREDIDDQKKENITKVIREILGPSESGKVGEINKYKINLDEFPDHKLARVSSVQNRQNANEQFWDSFATDLLKAELVTDGKGEFRRNQTILQGILIIKATDQRVIFLKLEETLTWVDKQTFTISEALSIDKKYYKAAIYDGLSINVIDKNANIAKFWVSVFLKIEPLRTPTINTSDLMNLFTQKKIFSPDIYEEEDYPKLKTEFQNYINTETEFDLEEFSDLLRGIPGMDQYERMGIYSTELLSTIDNNFVLDKQVIDHALTEVLTPNKYAKVTVSNFPNARKGQNISYEKNRIIIRIDADNEDKIARLFFENE